MDQKAQEVVEVDSCLDSCQLFRIAKQSVREKKAVVGLVVL